MTHWHSLHLLLWTIVAIRAVHGDCDDWQAALDQHNAYRAQHSAPPLYWDSGLAAGAQDYANYLASAGCPLTHSGSGYGENLYVNSGYKPSGNCVDATHLWYSEASNYQYTDAPWSTNGGNFGAIGHFSQIVWKSTAALGCGVGLSGCTVVVCRYNPPGNGAWDAAFLENVLPPGGNGFVATQQQEDLAPVFVPDSVPVPDPVEAPFQEDPVPVPDPVPAPSQDDVPEQDMEWGPEDPIPESEWPQADMPTEEPQDPTPIVTSRVQSRSSESSTRIKASPPPKRPRRFPSRPRRSPPPKRRSPPPRRRRSPPPKRRRSPPPASPKRTRTSRRLPRPPPRAARW